MNPELSSVIAELAQAAAYLRSPFFQQQLLQAAREGAIMAHSQWCDRATAAAYACCSPTAIDKAANMGIIKRYHRGNAPMFRKAEIDAALQNGTWVSKAA